ncbi:MAG: Eco57I restriction-modification methylase domain-containing protein, partial [Cyanobacteriota bacterium]
CFCSGVNRRVDLVGLGIDGLSVGHGVTRVALSTKPGQPHFLLAAARRLALELARIRAEDEEPSEELRQQCLRDVVAHCIYGVDKNPMAVELCKVALWIEAVDPGKPLSFLDAHIQCGDSLVGVFDPKLLEQGIPDEAYKPLTGDDKPTCTSLKKENASFRKAGQKGTLQTTLNLQASPPINRSQQRLQEIEAMPETTLAESAAKQGAYEAWEQERSSDPQTLAADLYTAAFFLPKTKDSRAKVPTSQHLLLLQSGQEIPGDLELAVEQAARDFRFFHWHLRFGEVMERGGFDCVLGNPPFGGNVGSFGESSSITEEESMEYISSQFKSAKNAFDISLAFFEAAVQVLCSLGTYGMFTPLGTWSSKGGRAWRDFLEDNAPPYFFLVASEGHWFSGASVQTGALCGGTAPHPHDAIEIVKTQADFSLVGEKRPRNISRDSYFEAVSGDSKARIPTSTCSTFPLAEHFEVLAGCSTGAAYELVPFIYDDASAPGRKLINTKLIDRYRSRWGRVAIKYLKSDYAIPSWPPLEEPSLPSSVRNALKRQMRPKLLVAGLTKVLEAFGDYEDECAGVVQTWAVVHADNNHSLLRRLNACINSWYASYQYWRMEGSQSIVGGGMTIKKAALQRLLIPISILESGHQNAKKQVTEGTKIVLSSLEHHPADRWSQIESLCKEIEVLAITSQPFLHVEEAMNRLICQTYGLTDDDFDYLRDWHSSRDLLDAER